MLKLFKLWKKNKIKASFLLYEGYKKGLYNEMEKTQQLISRKFCFENNPKIYGFSNELFSNEFSDELFYSSPKIANVKLLKINCKAKTFEFYVESNIDFDYRLHERSGIRYGRIFSTQKNRIVCRGKETNSTKQNKKTKSYNPKPIFNVLELNYNGKTPCFMKITGDKELIKISCFNCLLTNSTTWFSKFIALDTLIYNNIVPDVFILEPFLKLVLIDCVFEEEQFLKNKIFDFLFNNWTFSKKITTSKFPFKNFLVFAFGLYKNEPNVLNYISNFNNLEDFENIESIKKFFLCIKKHSEEFYSNIIKFHLNIQEKLHPKFTKELLYFISNYKYSNNFRIVMLKSFNFVHGIKIF